MRINIDKSLEWVAFFTTAKDAIIRSTPEQVKIFLLLLVGVGLHPNRFKDDSIPLDEISREDFPLLWGIPQDLKAELQKDSPLWKVGKDCIRIPLYAYRETEKTMKKRNSGSLGGRAKARNQRRRISADDDNAQASTSQREPEYTIPEHLKSHDHEHEADDTPSN